MLRGTVSEDGGVTLHFLRILTSFAYCQCKLNTRMTCSMLNALDSPFIISIVVVIAWLYSVLHA